MPAHSPINLPPAELRRYLLAGRSVFTMKNTARGSHYSYKVSFNGHYPAWVHSLHGGEPKLIGMINPERKFYRVRRSELPVGAPALVCFGWLWDRLEAGKALPASVEAWHHGECCRCARLLTDPKSLARGFGPHCWEVMRGGLRLRSRLLQLVDDLEDGLPSHEVLPSELTGIPVSSLATLLTLLAGDSVEQWSQARELAVAAYPSALPQIDGIIAAQLSTITGGKATRALARATAKATIDPFWIPAVTKSV